MLWSAAGEGVCGLGKWPGLEGEASREETCCPVVHGVHGVLHGVHGVVHDVEHSVLCWTCLKGTGARHVAIAQGGWHR